MITNKRIRILSLIIDLLKRRKCRWKYFEINFPYGVKVQKPLADLNFEVGC